MKIEPTDAQIERMAWAIARLREMADRVPYRPTSVFVAQSATYTQSSTNLRCTQVVEKAFCDAVEAASRKALEDERAYLRRVADGEE